MKKNEENFEDEDMEKSGACMEEIEEMDMNENTETEKEHEKK